MSEPRRPTAAPTMGTLGHLVQGRLLDKDNKQTEGLRYKIYCLRNCIRLVVSAGLSESQ